MISKQVNILSTKDLFYSLYDKGSHSFIKVLDSPVTGGYILDLQGGMNDGIMYTSGTSDKAISNTNCGEQLSFE